MHMHRNAFASLISVVCLGCQDQLPSEPDPFTVQECSKPPVLGLDEYCSRDQGRQQFCALHATYAQSLEGLLGGCAERLAPVAIGECELRVIDRRTELGGVTFYFDAETEDLVGIRIESETSVECPPGSPRARSVQVERVGAVDDECDVCHLCGRDDRDLHVCTGAAAEPYLQSCRESFDLPPDCLECTCAECLPWTHGGFAETAELLHACIADRCSVCDDALSDG